MSDDDLFDDLRDALRGPTEPAAPRLPAAPPPIAIPGYELGPELARGGQGVVYLATQVATRRTVALKLLAVGSGATLRELLRFEREVELAAGLQHPDIVTVYDSGEASGCPWYAMEHVEGGVSLTEHLRGRPVGERLRLFVRVCAAVGHAHRRGVIHRDLKPGNILVTADGAPRILDFGLARLAGDGGLTDGGLTAGGEFLGTIAYAAPEQTLGDPSAISLATDVYALGVILFELLTGELPYPTDGPLAEVLGHIASTPARPPGAGTDVDTVALTALAKDPERRYASAVELADDLARALAGEAIAARRDSSLYVLRTLLRRHWLGVAVVASFAVLVLASAVALAWQRDLARQSAQDARRARVDEARARDRAETEAYLASIAAAAAALREHRVVDCRDRLDRAPASRRGWEWRHLRARLDTSVQTYGTPGETYVRGVAYLPDGRIVSASWDGRVRCYDDSVLLWDHDTGGPLQCMATRADGQVALGGRDGRLILLAPEADGGRVVRRIAAPEAGPLTALAYAPDGRTIAAAYGPRSVALWSTTTGALVRLVETAPGFTGALAFRDGELAVGGWGLRLYDPATGALRRRLRRRVHRTAALAYAGETLVSAEGLAVLVWADGATLGSGPTRQWEAHRHPVFGLAVHGDQLASCSRDGTVRRWSLDGRPLTTHLGHTWTTHAVAFRPDGRELASASWDGTVKRWSTAALPRRLRGHARKVFAVAFSPDSRHLASVGLDGARLWRLDDGSHRVLVGHEGPIRNLAFSPDGATLATAGRDRTVRLWRVPDGAPLRTLEGHTERVLGVAFSPDGRRLASGTADNDLRIWTLADGRFVRLPGHDDHIHTIAFSPDGRWLASCGHRSVRVWDGATGAPLRTFPRQILQDDFALAFHPRAPLLVAGADRNTMRSWNLETLSEAGGWQAHTDEIHSCAFDPGGTRLVSASYDQTVRLWDTRERALLMRLTGFGETKVNGVAWSPDGRHVAAALSDGSIMIWSAPER